MTEDPDRLAELRALADRVASTGHDDLQAASIDAVRELATEVDAHLDREERLVGARKLLAFWESFVETKLERVEDRTDAIAADTIARFEQAFDEDVIGIDLYQALETLAIVEDMDEPETEQDRLSQWTGRVLALTEDFAAHLQGHKDE